MTEKFEIQTQQWDMNLMGSQRQLGSTLEKCQGEVEKSQILSVRGFIRNNFFGSGLTITDMLPEE